MQQVFVTGMLRSGTSLLQTLLTNHPDLFVAYQPFHQLYVDAKQMFLDEQGWQRLLPLGDGMDAASDEPDRFAEWLASRSFDSDEVTNLAARATTGKGGSATDLPSGPLPGGSTFLELREAMHARLAAQFGKEDAAHIGSKEVLCEEYLPALAAAGVRCLLIVRDPRAVVASANHGRYRELVGDRYPLLMLVRLWRKSAQAWLAMAGYSGVTVLRYEDLVSRTDSVLDAIAGSLCIPAFPCDLMHSPLRDHRSQPWKGNSSFGDKATVDAVSDSTWKTMLSDAEVHFIEACTWPEMAALGYAPGSAPQRSAIAEFAEDTTGVRPGYLRHYALDVGNRDIELGRWDAGTGGNGPDHP
jgi:hypothetical protein